MNKGIFIVGDFLGYIKKPWKNDPSRVNHQMSLLIGKYTDDFGVETPETVVVELHPEAASHVEINREKFIGQQLSVAVSVTARKWNDKTWVSYYVRQGAELNVIPKESRKAG